jgi:arylsulfatase
VDIDQQLKRVFDTLQRQGELENTFVLMTSDHGEMLGDHHLWRKTYAFEGSARVPLLVRPPASMGVPCDRLVDAPVGLEDIIPTLLSIAGAEVPETVEGQNLLGLLSGNGGDRRAYYHGEHAPIYHAENATQYLVSEETKYIWNPVTGDEFLFDLGDDPGETMNLAGEDAFRDDRDRWRERLAERLSGRPEGFLEDGDLSTVSPKRLDPET